MPGRKRLVFTLTLLTAGLSVLFAVAQTKPGPATVKSPQPLWGDVGIVVNNTLGNSPQQNPKLVNTSDGNLAMVWEDGRNGYINIFAQKIDGSGTRLWSDVGVQACVSTQGAGDQNAPSLIDDGAGGIIVVWQSYGNGSATKVYAQRIGASGAQLWGPAGVPICTAPAGQFAPEIVTDGAGGAIITWYDYRNGAGEDIYAQRVDKDGKVLWQENGVPVCVATGTQWYPKIGSDGVGGAIIVWTDGRSGASDDHIYGQRLGPDGKPLWEKDGIALCAAPNNQEKPVIMAAGKEAIIAWQDSRSGNVDIYAQKIDLDGKALWDKDGIAVVTAPYSQEDPQLSLDGAGGALIAWTDNREDDAAIYAQKISADGKIEWSEAGRQLAKSQGKQTSPKIIKLPTADWLVVWEDSRNGSPLLFGQKINSSGVTLWPEGGLPLAPGGKSEEKAVVAPAPDGQIIVVWQDRRSEETDLFGQKVSAAGLLAWSDNGQVLVNAPGSVVHQNVSMIDSGRGEIIMVFEDARSGFSNIYAQKLSLQGDLLWGKNAIPLARVKADQTNPRLVSDGAGGALVIWEDHRNPAFTKIYGQRLTASGKKSWEGGSHQLTELDSQQTSPVIISDGDGGAIVVWMDERNPLSLKDLYAQRISSTGEQLWDVNEIPICTANGDQVEPAMIADGKGGGFLAWTDYRKGDRDPDIYAQHFDPTGKLLWGDKDGLLVCGAPDVQKSPGLSDDGEGGTIIAWTDKGGGSNDIYAQRVSLDGKPQWLTDGIPVCQAPRTQQNPLISNQVVVWEDYRYGNWDIFANSVSLKGQLLWGDEGVPVVVQPLTQYAPQIVPWKGQNTIVVWEDYRNGKQYETYMQMLDYAGKTQWGENGFLVKSTDGARVPKILAVPNNNVFLVVWEDYTGGGKAIAAQLYSAD